METDEHLEPTEELTLRVVKERAVKGVIVLTGRTFVLQIISFAAWFLLSVFLDATQIGVFFIVSAVVNFMRYFSDVGLAAALIQKKEEVNEHDLKTTFTIQQVLVVLLLVLLFLLTPIIKRYYSLSPEGLVLMYSLGIAFFMSSLKTIPSILLERELRFGKLVIPDVLENLVYNLTAVFFAWRGFGVSSFAFAVVCRGMVGLLAIYVIKPWRPGFAFSKGSLKKLLKFGIPYQVNTFLATIKDDGMTALLGGILGPAGIGFLGWAQKWSQTPLRLFLDNVTRVTFPAFSRLQDQKQHLADSVTRSIFFVCFLVFPAIVVMVTMAPILILIVPRYEKWQPALTALSLVSINVLFAAATTQLTNLLNAIGKIKFTFRLMVMWTVLTWIFVPFLALRYGLNGAASGYSLVGISSIVAIFMVLRLVKFSVKDSIIKPAFSALAMFVVMLLLRGIVPPKLISVIFMCFVGTGIYFWFTYLTVGPSLTQDVKKTLQTLFARH